LDRCVGERVELSAPLDLAATEEQHLEPSQEAEDKYG